MDTRTHIGPYRVIRQLGEGGFATVWLAADDMLDAPIAIKLLAERWIGREDIRAKFINEARLLRRIDDDRVVRVYAVDELVHGQPYFVMAWADRGTLYDRLAVDPMRYSVESALELAADLTECLVLIHSYGIVHRDIKPSNILFRSRPSHLVGEGSPPERLLLGDFGVATTPSADPRLTGPVGTPAYMAPEQAAYSDGIDARADIFAATAVLYELLSGHPAFETRTAGDVGHAVVVDPIVATRPGVPLSLQELVDRGLSMSPQDRFPSAREFAAAIRRELKGVAEPGPATQPSRPTVVDRAVEADPAEAVAVLVDHCAGVLPELESRWAKARANLQARFRVTIVADAASRPLIAAAAPERPDMQLSGHDPGDLDHPDGRLARASDVLIVAVPDQDFGRVLELLRTRLAAITSGPVCVLSVRAGTPANGAGSPADVVGGQPANRRIIPSATFDRSQAGCDALWSHVSDELAGWGSWARGADSLAVVADALADAVATPTAQDARRDLLDHVESLRLAQPRLAEVQFLRSEATGNLPIAPQLRSELRRILGPGAPCTRLGLGPDATSGEMLNSARQGSERWRALINTGNIPYSARPAGTEVARAYDRLWVSIA
jgi:hypothetical protein